MVSAIPITRRGWYRAVFKHTPDFALLIPVQFNPTLSFSELLAWPGDCDWNRLEYVQAPRTADESKVML